MKKIFFIITFFGIFAGGSVLAYDTDYTISQVYQNNTVGIKNDYFWAQEFVAPAFSALYKIDIRLGHRYSNPTGDVDFELYESDSNGLPAGRVIQSASIGRSDIGYSILVKTIFFDNPKVLGGGQKYVLKMTCDTCDGSNFYESRISAGNDEYPDGLLHYYTDDWYEWVGGDLWFNFYFTVPTLPIAYNASGDILATAGTLFTDLWTIIALVAGVPLAFLIINKVRDMIINNAK